MFKIIKRVEYTFQEVLRIMYTKNQERINHLWGRLVQIQHSVLLMLKVKAFLFFTETTITVSKFRDVFI